VLHCSMYAAVLLQTRISALHACDDIIHTTAEILLTCH
jgi:hypothetical protein